MQSTLFYQSENSCLANMSGKKPTKGKGKEEAAYEGDLKLEEEMASMLKSEYGEDTEVLELIEELEKAPEEEASSDKHAKEGDSNEIRHCPNCRFDALFINACCTECGHTLGEKPADSEGKEGADDDSDFSGYNTDSDE